MRPSSRVSTKRTSSTTVRFVTSSRCCTVSAGFPHFDMNAQWSDPQPVSRTPHKDQKNPTPASMRTWLTVDEYRWVRVHQRLLRVHPGTVPRRRRRRTTTRRPFSWQRHARQPSPASDVSEQENASRAIDSESALLPMVGLSLPLTCTGHRGSARSISKERESCAKENCGFDGGVMPRFDYNCGIDFFYPWPRIAGN